MIRMLDLVMVIMMLVGLFLWSVQGKNWRALRFGEKKSDQTHHDILWETARLEHELGLIPHSSEAIKEVCTPCKVVRPRKMASGGTKPALQKDSVRISEDPVDVYAYVWGQTEPVYRMKTQSQPVEDEAFDENEPLDDQIRNSI